MAFYIPFPEVFPKCPQIKKVLQVSVVRQKAVAAPLEAVPEAVAEVALKAWAKVSPVKTWTGLFQTSR
jgi:hypothetical protein